MPAHEALFRFTTNHAGRIYEAIAPELTDEVNPRSATRCWMEGSDTLVLQVNAQDIPAMRAALNMVLRLILIADEMQDLVNR